MRGSKGAKGVKKNSKVVKKTVKLSKKTVKLSKKTVNASKETKGFEKTVELLFYTVIPKESTLVNTRSRFKTILPNIAAGELMYREHR